ncbi:hypothetical protein ACFQJD_16140 [Haloplanus sp. GCM10025708]
MESGDATDAGDRRATFFYQLRLCFACIIWTRPPPSKERSSG